MENFHCILISLNRLRTQRFCFRSRLEDPVLFASVKKQGLIQPLAVVQKGNTFELLSGHKRLYALQKLKRKTVSVIVLPTTDSQKLFLLALALNYAAGYTDIDRAKVIEKAQKEFHFDSLSLQNWILPGLGLVSSSKILKQYQEIAALPPRIQAMIQNQVIPFQGSAWLAKFKKSDLDFFARRILPWVRLSANQMAHACEWLLDLAQIQKKSISSILKASKIPLPRAKGADLRANADIVYRTLRRLRFPELTAKETVFKKSAQELRGQVEGLEVRAPEYFEGEGFYLHAHIRNAEVWKKVLQQLQASGGPASALFDTLL